jgi:hypothetical protein
MGEVLTYKFGQKNNWRNRCWNIIAESHKKRLADAKVLYLCGPEDLDREVAIRKGFKDKNLFAVSNDKDVVAALRAKKRSVIYGDILEVAQAFGEKLDVLHLDLCTGLDSDVQRIAMALFANVKIGGTLLVNFQRGRDASSNHYRKLLEPTMQTLKRESDRKHRGLYFYFYTYWLFIERYYKPFHTMMETGGLSAVFVYLNAHPQVAKALFEAYELAMPFCFFTYKSNVVLMDSIVITNFLMALQPLKNTVVKRIKNNTFRSGEALLGVDSSSLVRQIAAVKAVRTRRFET